MGVAGLKDREREWESFLNENEMRIYWKNLRWRNLVYSIHVLQYDVIFNDQWKIYKNEKEIEREKYMANVSLIIIRWNSSKVNFCVKHILILIHH